MVFGICILPIPLIFFGDLWIKNKIEKNDWKNREVWNGRLILSRYHNQGAFLNFGEKRSKVIAVISVLFSVVLLFAFIASMGKYGNNMLRVGLSFLLGGAFNNTYDRLKRRYVVDYVSFGVKWKKLRRVVFNISDFCIMIGALVACIGAIK